MMKNIKLEIGDVILIPTTSKDGLYTILMKWQETQFKDNILLNLASKLFLNYLKSQTGHEYIHQELYLGNGWHMSQTGNGVMVYKPSLDMYQIGHVYRYINDFDKNQFLKIAKMYHNKQYDYTSLILNAGIELFSLNNEQVEQEMENTMKQMYDNPNQMICSELVQRVYEDLGIKIERWQEYVTPDDIQKSPLFKRVL